MGLRLPSDAVVLLGVIDVPDIPEQDRLHSVEAVHRDLAVFDLDHGPAVEIILFIPDVLDVTDPLVQLIGDHRDALDARDTELALLTVLHLDRKIELFLVEDDDLPDEGTVFSFNVRGHNERKLVSPLDPVDDLKTLRGGGVCTHVFPRSRSHRDVYGLMAVI